MQYASLRPDRLMPPSLRLRGVHHLDGSRQSVAFNGEYGVCISHIEGRHSSNSLPVSAKSLVSIFCSFVFFSNARARSFCFLFLNLRTVAANVSRLSINPMVF